MKLSKEFFSSSARRLISERFGPFVAMRAR
jgi:hypothetical protein